jgi:hypothetical protein
LKSKRIIAGRRDGTEVYYSVISAEAKEIIAALFAPQNRCV